MMLPLPAKRIWDGTIILVADPVDPQSPTDAFDRRIDRPYRSTVEEISDALLNCCDQLIIVDDLTNFTTELHEHLQSLVFPYWFGESSRSRHGLVPAICEANNVMFVGADAFVKVVCNDKELSKSVCRQCGLNAPGSITIHSLDDLSFVKNVRPPVVVKPNYEGTSLGITQRNLCRSLREILDIAETTLKRLGQPVIIEEFIEGREFSACLFGDASGKIDVEVGSWKIDGRSDYLDSRLNTFDLKLPNELAFQFDLITEQINENELTAMKRCFESLGKVELLRIDGRLNKAGLFIIELTPDIYLGSNGEYFLALRNRFTAYSNLIARIVSNSLKWYQAEMPVS
jgi:D-alanine-D-alanine ligase